jgi:dTDP-4-dehydrorhamnose 3,5-epimerase
MNISATSIKDLLILHPSVFEDDRGYFFESYNENEFNKNGIQTIFVQDNQSLSHKGVLRGLHFQSPPFAQAKLVRVLKGSVLDVAVDIRKKSETFGKYFSIELNERNKTMLYIPEGFAHGFVTLENQTIFSYKCSNYYNKESERCLLWNDKTLSINWNIKNPIISKKDELGVSFSELTTLF